MATKQCAKPRSAPSSRAGPHPTEYQIQAAFIEQLRWLEKQHPVLKLGFHVPSGEARTARVNAKGRRYSLVGQRLKRLGLRPGVPDWCLPVARGGFIGLWIEFKRSDARPTAIQSLYIVRLEQEGHLVLILRDAEDAVKKVLGYLGIG